MESAEFRALEGMITALLASLVHAGAIDSEPYLTRVRTFHMLRTDSGDHATAMLLLAHMEKLERTLFRPE